MPKALISDSGIQACYMLCKVRHQAIKWTVMLIISLLEPRSKTPACVILNYMLYKVHYQAIKWDVMPVIPLLELWCKTLAYGIAKLYAL